MTERRAIKRILAQAGSHAVTVLLALAVGAMVVVAIVAVRVMLSVMH